MTFGQFLSILRARWWVVLLVLGLTVATTVVVSLLLPKQYTATASVGRRLQARPDLRRSSAVCPARPSWPPRWTSSPASAWPCVWSQTKLSENPQIRQQWQDETGGEGTVEQWLITLFQKSLDVQPSRESSVIRVGYKAPTRALRPAWPTPSCRPTWTPRWPCA
jgi:succinoglycan biosynthesis transport protein ExoP